MNTKESVAKCECGYQMTTTGGEIHLEKFGFRKINRAWYCFECIAAGKYQQKGGEKK